MKKILSVILAITMIMGMGTMTAFAQAPAKYINSATEKIDKNLQTRLIITSDAEVDDINSFLMLLLYANEFDIEGIIYCSSFVHFNGDGEHTLGEITPGFKCELEGAADFKEWRPLDLEYFQKVIREDYAVDYEYLIQNDPNYPSPEELLEKVKVGNVEFEGDTRFDTEGSDLIKECILDDDERTLYVINWGGFNTLCRALISIAEEYQDTEEWPAIQEKVVNKVIYHANFQDTSYADNNIAELYPGLREYYQTMPGFGYFATYDGPIQVRDRFAAPWLTENLKTNHGKVMEQLHLMNDGQYLNGEPDIYQYGLVDYIDWGTDLGLTGFPRFDFETNDWIAVTDAPCWIVHIPVGLRGPENPNLGSWGGRVKIDGNCLNSKNTYDEYNYYTGTMDGGFGASRYMEALFEDWAARAEWAVGTYEECNHAPVVRADQLDITAAPGEIVELNASISDPDGDDLQCKWWVYEEASEYSGTCTGMEVWDSSSLPTKFTVPQDALEGDYITVVLEVKDSGHKHDLTRYAEILVHVEGDVDNSASSGRAQALTEEAEPAE